MAGTKVTPTIKSELEKARDRIAAVLPKHMDVDKVIVSVRLAIAQNPDLQACTFESILFAVMAAARVGLELNSPLQHAWLIPFKRECTLMVGYRGFQELARRGGDVRNIEARCVYTGDEFSYQLGSEPRIHHVPVQSVGASGRGDENLSHVYAIAFDKNAKPFAFEVMTRDEVEAARKISRAGDKGPWVTWYSEMARKTAVRRLAKYLPLSADLAAAIELDLRAETGQVQAPIEGLDTDLTLSAGMAQRTEEKLGELRERMGGQPAKAGGAEPAPLAPATASPPAAAPDSDKTAREPW